jgi:c(7)-type cytochrome triheme protein
MKTLVRSMMIIFLCTGAANAVAGDCVSMLTYEGKGAGEVVFNMAKHMAKGLTCADCHEQRGFTSPLFEMKRGASNVSMKKMEMGKSCGYCHDGRKTFSVTRESDCSRCHHKS